MIRTTPGHKKCDYCTEIIISDLFRCPFCLSIQKSLKKKKLKENNQPELTSTNNEKNLSELSDVLEEVLATQEKKLSEKAKVFISALSFFFPLLGQVFGVISSVVHMNSKANQDKAFGRALLTACVCLFAINSIVTLILILALFT